MQKAGKSTHFFIFSFLFFSSCSLKYYLMSMNNNISMNINKTFTTDVFTDVVIVNINVSRNDIIIYVSCV